MINLPEQFIQQMKEILNDEFEVFLNSYNMPAKKALRLNREKDLNLQKMPFLQDKVPWCDDGYYYSEERPGKHVYHEMGLYYIQEPSAMAVVEELNVENSDLVLDLCAAPGGKSTQIASKLKDGYLISNEIVPQRAKVLSSNIERMGIKNALVLNESPNKLAERFAGFFNKVLVDAPCSGEGMFRKNNEAVQEWSVDNVKMCANRQLEILECAAKMCANSARLVFSTCTFSKIENEGVIKEFLLRHKEFSLVETKNKFECGIDLKLTQRLYPHKINGEGHFIAVMQKNEGENKKVDIQKKRIKQHPAFLKFVKESLNIEIEYNTQLKDNLYISPNINLDKLKVARFGFHLGEIKKDRFEPSHALALALKKEDFKNIIEFSSDSDIVKKYLRGEVFETDKKGWACVVVDNNPLGWAKCDGNQAKNHYPKGCRKDLF